MSAKEFFTVGKFVKIILVGFVLYLVIGSTIPYAMSKTVSETNKQQLKKI